MNYIVFEVQGKSRCKYLHRVLGAGTQRNYKNSKDDGKGMGVTQSSLNSYLNIAAVRRC